MEGVRWIRLAVAVLVFALGCVGAQAAYPERTSAAHAAATTA